MKWIDHNVMTWEGVPVTWREILCVPALVLGMCAVMALFGYWVGRMHP